MKKILVIMLAFVLVCCGTIQYVDTTNYGQTMEKSIDGLVSAQQFDSICKTDTLPILDDWEKSPIKNDETNEYEYQYLYIKSIDKNQCIYRVELSNKSDSIRITKRITY